MTRTAIIALVASLAATASMAQGLGYVRLGDIEGESLSMPADAQSEVQFRVQLGTSDLQNAESVRSQAVARPPKIAD